MLGRTRDDQLKACLGAHFDLTDLADGDERARRVVGLHPVAHVEPARRREPQLADQRPARERDDVPGIAVTAPEQEQHQHGRGGERHPIPATPTDARFDSGPQVARRLDALRQLADGVLQLVFVHCSNFSRNSRRARNSCAFDVPSAMPVSSAISPWPYPSMSKSTNTSRAPSGSSAIARSRSMPRPSIVPRGLFSRTAGSAAGVTRRSRRLVVRRSLKTTFTASRCSQELNALSPRNEPSLSQSRTKTSCVRSSASRTSPVRRRQSA